MIILPGGGIAKTHTYAFAVFGVGIIFILISIPYILVSLLVETDPEFAKGTIVTARVDEKREGKIYYYYEVKYTVDGEQYDLTEGIDPEHFYKYQVGDHVTVRYASVHPSFADLPGVKKQENLFLFLLVGVLCVLGGYVVSLIAGIIERRRGTYHWM